MATENAFEKVKPVQVKNSPHDKDYFYDEQIKAIMAFGAVVAFEAQELAAYENKLATLVYLSENKKYLPHGFETVDQFALKYLKWSRSKTMSLIKQSKSIGTNAVATLDAMGIQKYKIKALAAGDSEVEIIQGELVPQIKYLEKTIELTVENHEQIQAILLEAEETNQRNQKLEEQFQQLKTPPVGDIDPMEFEESLSTIYFEMTSQFQQLEDVKKYATDKNTADILKKQALGFQLLIQRKTETLLADLPE